MTAKQPGWRSMARRYNWLTRDLARKARESVHREREALAATVCPDPKCPQPRCVAARACIMAGGSWRDAFAILHPKDSQ